MVEFFRQLDQQLFIFINGDLASGFLDVICPVLRHQQNWYIVYAALVFIIYRHHKKNTLWIVLGAALLILITDQLSATLIKNAVQRLRPCNDPGFKDHVRLLVHCGSGFSFVSTHATNHFALAVFIAAIFRQHGRWVTVLALIWAGSIAFSQVYVGVHYPFDVLCGALLGAAFGYGAALLTFKKITKQE